MLRTLTAALILAASPAFAQHADNPPHKMGHGAAMNHQHMKGGKQGRPPTEAGQSAFAAIQEIVQILEADPRTDWSKVNIDALRQHLVDMNNVTLAAAVTSSPAEGGIRYTVTGTGAVRDSIRRMVMAHASTMDGVGGWSFTAAEIDDGATLTVVVPPGEAQKLKALGFVGVMTHGMHHQEHHLMIARGDHPHR